MLMTVVNGIVTCGTLKGIQNLIAPLTPMQRHEALRAAAEVLSDEVEVQIAEKNTHHAMWIMSKLALIDDLALQEERKAHGVIQIERLERVGV